MAVHVTLTNRIPDAIADMNGEFAEAVESTLLHIVEQARPTSPIDQRSVTMRHPKGQLEGAAGVFNRRYFYVGFLEWGKGHHSPKPWLTPVAENARPTFLAEVTAAWVRVCRGR